MMLLLPIDAKTIDTIDLGYGSTVSMLNFAELSSERFTLPARVQGQAVYARLVPQYMYLHVS